MKKGLLSILLLCCFIDRNYAQTDGVVSFDVPAKNSLKFNKFLINPTFSFVREDESFINLHNKTQWSEFENAPKAYFVSYSGKFREDNGIAFGIFKRNYGILTSFGAVGNFARNIAMSNDNNFTFGLNLAYLNSGLNTGDIITNDLTDPSLQNIPKNSLVTINPGINYSTAVMDFGLSANNIFTYNFSDSGLVSEDPAKSVAGHIMYTGYMYNSGFFENAKFSTMIKGEMAKDKTILSGSVLFNAPRGGWVQAGYNSLYGVSGGLGLIIAKKISIGYTVEKGMGNFSNFGISHEIVLAYKIKGYGDYEDYKPIVKASKKTNPGAAEKKVAIKKKTPAELKKERDEQLALKAEQERARLEEERLRKEKDLADARAKAEADARAKAEAEKLLAIQGREAAEARAKAEAEARIKAEQDKAKAIAEAERLRREKEAADAKAKLDAAAKAKADKLKADADAKAQAEAERLRLIKEAADARAKVAADAKAKADADAKAKADAEAERLRLAKEAADAKTKSDADAKAKADAERLRLAKEAADARAKVAADAKAKADADAKAKADAEAERLRLAKEAADAKTKSDADAKVKADAERLRLAKEAADAKAKADADAKVKADADAKAKADAEAERLRLAKEAADAKTKSDADAKAKADAERLRLAKEAADAKAKADADAKAKADAEAERLRLAKEAADAKVKADAEAKSQADAEKARLAKEAADAKAKADADAKAKADAEAERLRLAKEAADAKVKADAEAKSQADAEKARLAKEAADAKAKADAEAKAKADAEAEKLRLEAEAKAKLDANKTAEDKQLDYLSQVIDDSKKNQSESLARLDSIAKSKENELLELRRVNDLSEQGIVSEVKEYQSTSAANRALEVLKAEIEENNKNTNNFISEYEKLYKERIIKVPNKNDIVNQNYLKTINQLKAEKIATDKRNADLLAKLERIKTETDIEKKRRIKQAKFDNNQTKYLKDRETLKQIKLATTPNSKVYKPEDFDFGEEDLSNMQIVKNIENIDKGFYLVVAAHKDEVKRDAFIKKAIESGQTNIDFFYNVSTSTYYIYYQKFSDIQDATRANELKGNKPYNGKMVIVKVE
ncbi:PorP/SprF family type IX secretion system membrane protein [Flavobacterium sp.]|uniref:PorP/SprF family type IX secretion system membrane protein n=1 Tax=Flavobacterium sp. TaxID=239 RepID=UPI003D6C55AB